MANKPKVGLIEGSHRDSNAFLVQCALDVHAIDELKQNKGLKPTDDLPKYDYEGDVQGTYSTTRNASFASRMKRMFVV